MNVLFCNFDESWHVDVINGLIDKMELSSVSIISVLPLKVKCKDNLVCNSSTLNRHKLGYNYGFPMIPLDGEILEKMSSYEDFYLKMLDRNELDFGKKLSYEKRKHFYYNDIQVMLSLLSYRKINLCVFSTIPHIGFDYILYGLCKELGIKVIIQYFGVPIPNKTATMYFISDIKDHFPQLRGIDWKLKIADIELSPRMQAYIDCYDRNKEEITSFVHYSDVVNKKENKYLAFAKLFIKSIVKGTLIASVKRKVYRKYLIKTVDMFLESNCSSVVDGEKYLYFPMHYQPECTSLPMGGYYYDQILIIKLIASLLPKGVYLYVKPHPNRNLFADVTYYKEIVKIDNVRLLSDRDNTYGLIDNALAVVSITGTAICESLVRGKPVMMFGYYLWQYAPGVFHCTNEKSCKDAINKICNENYMFSREEFVAFLSELDKYLYDGTLAKVYFKIFDYPMDKNIENIINGLVAYYETIK